jgi:signal transduction histidine kinase/ligand-binding sensor domain-containing protein
MKTIFIGILIALTVCQSTKAQTYTGYTHLSTQQGLSGDLVNCLLEDSRGMMWIGTKNGLNLYNCYDFEVMKLSNQDVVSLLEDRKKNIWVGTNKGINVISLIDYNIQHIASPDAYPDLQKTVKVLFYDSQQNLWVVTDSQQIYRFDTRQKTWKYITTYPSNSNANYLQQIYETPHTEEIHILALQEVRYIYELKTSKLTTLSLKQNVISSRCNTDNAILYYQKSNYENAYLLDVYDESQTPVLKGFEGNNRMGQIIHRYRDMLWLSNEQGLVKYDPKQKKIIYQCLITQTPEMQDYKITDFWIDKSETLWVATSGFGVLVYAPQSLGNIQLIRKTSNLQPYGLRGRSVRTTFIDKQGLIWAGAYTTKAEAGLSILEGKTGYEKSFIPLPEMPISLSIDADEPDKYLWVGLNEYGGIAKVNQSNFKIEQQWTNLPAYTIWKILSAEKDKLWMITRIDGFTDSHLAYFDLKTEKLQHFALANQNLITLHIDHQKHIWVASTQGNVYKFDPKTKQFKLIFQTQQLSVRELISDKEGNLWIATLGGGLWQYHPDSKKRKIFTQREGLPSNTIFSLQLDNQGNLWLGTLKGLCKLNPKTGATFNLTPEDGLQNNEFNTNAVYYDSQSNQMVFGGINGINLFNPDLLNKNTYSPPMVLTKIQKLGKNLAWTDKAIQKKDDRNITISFPLAEAQMISLEFAALSYYQSQHNQYRYTIEGLNNNWIELGTKNSLTLSNLGAGSYIIRIKGANHHGQWSKNELRIQLVIVPPFWQTPLFIGLVSLLVISLAFYFMYRRSLTIQIQNLWLEKEVKLRTQEILEKNEEILTQNNLLTRLNLNKDRFFSMIAHDLRSPLISFQGISKQINFFLTKNETEKIKELGKNIDKSAQNLQILLDNLLTWSLLQQGEIGFKTEIVDVYTLAEDNLLTFSPSASAYQIKLTNHIPKDTLITADKMMLNTILHNFLSNAIKFTPDGGQVCLKIDFLSTGYLIICEDTGIGVAPEKIPDIFKVEIRKNSKGLHGEKGNGIGLPLCYEFALLHNGNINLRNKEGKGIVIAFYLPFTT